MKIHAQIHKEKKPFPCNVCQQNFTRAPSLRAHQGIHVGEKPLHCTECKKMFRLHPFLKLHQSTHIKIKSSVCVHCNKSFKREKGLEEHILCHTGGNPFLCIHCENSFPSEQNLRTHIKKVHGEKSSKLWSCNLCGKEYKHSPSAHIKRCMGSETLKCLMCEKSFTKPSVLQAHKKSHSLEKPYQCNQCGISLKRKDALKRHRIKHKEQQVFLDMGKQAELSWPKYECEI